mmetsp:Transcript_65094/g.187101  ORF Transcript_65094/g.187101 Transcript_65094/m.187101 type:complete len:258 (+) Transcript_65094:186-959(+)
MYPQPKALQEISFLVAGVAAVHGVQDIGLHPKRDFVGRFVLRVLEDGLGLRPGAGPRPCPNVRRGAGRSACRGGRQKPRRSGAGRRRQVGRQLRGRRRRLLAFLGLLVLLRALGGCCPQGVAACRPSNGAVVAMLCGRRAGVLGASLRPRVRSCGAAPREQLAANGLEVLRGLLPLADQLPHALELPPQRAELPGVRLLPRRRIGDPLKALLVAGQAILQGRQALLDRHCGTLELREQQLLGRGARQSLLGFVEPFL